MAFGRFASAAAGLIAAALVVSACGGGSSSSSSSAAPDSGAAATSSAAAPAEAGSSLKEMAAAKVAEFAAGPASYPGPTDAFDPGTGKAAVMACGFAAPVCAEQAQFAVEALTAMGWEAGQPFDGEFSPLVQAGFIDRAVQDGLDGVVLVSVDVNTIKASIDRAIKAGLIITCTMCTSGPDYAGKVIDVVVDWDIQGQMAAWAILAENGEESKVVSFSDAAFAPPPLRAAGLEKALAENCATCTYELVQFATGSISKPGPPEFTAVMAQRAVGDITNVVAHYDGLGMAIAKTVVQAGREDISVGGYDGSPDAIAALMSDNPPYAFSVAEPYTYAEWAAADLMARTKAGLPLWADFDNLPSTLIIRANAQKYLDGLPAPSTMPAPEGDWQGAFKQIWGKG
jgi:ABC-type sugar transport system substrate-binding protein